MSIRHHKLGIVELICHLLAPCQGMLEHLLWRGLEFLLLTAQIDVRSWSGKHPSVQRIHACARKSLISVSRDPVVASTTDSIVRPVRLVLIEDALDHRIWRAEHLSDGNSWMSAAGKVVNRHLDVSTRSAPVTFCARQKIRSFISCTVQKHLLHHVVLFLPVLPILILLAIAVCTASQLLHRRVSTICTVEKAHTTWVASLLNDCRIENLRLEVFFGTGDWWIHLKLVIGSLVIIAESMNKGSSFYVAVILFVEDRLVIAVVW